MKSIKLTVFALVSLYSIASAKTPAVLAKFFTPNKEVKGEIVKVDMPGEFLKYRQILAEAQAKDPEWYKKFEEKAEDQSLLLPYDAKLGISKAEYAKYKALYEKRKYKRVEGGEVSLMLTDNGDKTWTINVFAKQGITTPLSALSYKEEGDVFKSINGELVRIDDIKSPKQSVYREWNGYEWRYFNDSSLVKTKENMAIGRTGDGRYGLIFHSLQELSGQGQLLADNLLIIRFVPNKIKK